MKILGISGSASKMSSNTLLLEAISRLLEPQHQLKVVDNLSDFPLFTPQRLKESFPKELQEFKTNLQEADTVILSTPEYAHNIPAVVKNMLEWCTASGEFNQKKILPITFTPHEPRGEYAMKSLLFTLSTLNANIIAEMPLYKTEVTIKEDQLLLPEEIEELLLGAVEFF